MEYRELHFVHFVHGGRCLHALPQPACMEAIESDHLPSPIVEVMVAPPAIHGLYPTFSWAKSNNAESGYRVHISRKCPGHGDPVRSQVHTFPPSSLQAVDL